MVIYDGKDSAVVQQYRIKNDRKNKLIVLICAGHLASSCYFGDPPTNQSKGYRPSARKRSILIYYRKLFISSNVVRITNQCTYPQKKKNNAPN